MILIKPYLGCNISCEHCYQRDQLPVYFQLGRAHIEKIEETIDETAELYPTHQMVLHGGEILCVGHETVERLLKKIYDREGRSRLVTNGTLIDDKYIEIFRKYNTTVSLSIDGPDQLNERRTTDTDSYDELMTRMRAAGVEVFVITVLHGSNITDPDRLTEWLQDLGKQGIPHGRLNLVRGEAVDPEKVAQIFKNLLVGRFLGVDRDIEPLTEIIRSFAGGYPTVCNMKPCDPFCTFGAITILPDASRSCCLMGQVVSPHMNRNAEPTFMRQHALKQTECKGCRYWTMCYGGCYSFGDWRHKAPDCELRYKIYETVEKTLNGLGFETTIPSDMLPDFTTREAEIERRVKVNRTSDTTINGIRVIETPEKIRAIYTGEL
jgi:radical SAM protein with 4Fe4S-binding SPASM domain